MSTAARTLCGLVADTLDRHGLTDRADLLRTATRGASEGVPRPQPDQLPAAVAQRYYADALAAAAGSAAGDLAEALEPLGRRFSWTQTDTYVHAPPHDHFLERYAHATILGSRPETALLVDGSCTAAAGVLLIGPHNQYPHHQHHADEVYLPLTPADWSSALDAPYAELEPGAVLHHGTLQPHSVHTHDTSLLAVYVWTGDTTTSAWLCE